MTEVKKRLYLEVQAKLVSSFLSRVFISFLIGGVKAGLD